MAKKARKLTRKQRELAKLLGAKLMMSRSFRRDFLKNPRKAARNISIKLPAALHDEAVRMREEIIAAGKEADKALKKLEPLGGVIPYFTLEMD